MELKGNLDSHSLQEIFTTLARNKQIGTLIVSDGESTKYIYFARAGVRLLSSGKRKNIRLGDLLVKRNKITHDQLQAVLARQEETGEMVGKILTDWGLVTEEEIDEAVASQIEEEIFDLFTWENATFKFTEGAPPKELFDPSHRATRLTFDVNQMVQKASRYVDEMAKARELLPPPDTVFQLGEFTELEFYERDDADPVKRIVKAIDGFRTVQEVIEASGLNQLQTAEILGMLIRDKKIEKVESPLPHAEPGRELTDFVEQCERELERDPGNVALRERLAQAYFDLGDASRTIQHLSLVVQTAMRGGRLDEALATARRIAEIAPEDINNQEHILRIHFEMRDTDGVLSTASQLADLYWSAGDTERVKNMYKLVLEIVPEDIEIRKKLINLYLDSNDRDGAADEYEAIARILENRGNTAGLYEIYQKISRLAPHRKDLLKRLRASAEKPVVRIPRARFHFVRRFIKLLLLLTIPAAAGGAVWWEFKQRKEAEPRMKKADELRTKGEFLAAKEVLEEVKKAYPFSILAHFVVPEKLAEVDKARREDEARKRKAEADLLKREQMRWEELLGKEDTARQNSGTALLENLEALAKEMEAFQKDTKDPESAKKAAEWIQARKEHLAQAEAILLEAKTVESRDRRLSEGRKLRKRLMNRFDDTPYGQNLKMPFQILSDPSGAKVTLGEKVLGTTPLILYEDLEAITNTLLFLFHLDGYFQEKLEIDADEIYDKTDFNVVLKRKPLWSLKTGESIESAPACFGAMVYTGSRNGWLYAMDTRKIDPTKESTWVPAWRYKHPGRVGLGGIVYTPLPILNLVLYPHTDSYLYAVREDGTLGWNYGLGAGNSVIGTPLVHKKRLVIGAGKGKKGFLICLPFGAAAPNRRYWTFPHKDDPPILRLSETPLLDRENDSIYFSTQNGLVFCVDLFNGREIARFDLGSTISCPMAQEKGVLFAVTRGGILKTIDFTRVRTGNKPSLRWTYEVGEPVKAGLLAFSGRVIVCTAGEEKGRVIALDTRDPKKCVVKWTFPEGKTIGPIHATPVVSLGKLYIGSYDRTLYALSFWEGKEAWFFTSRGRINGLAVQSGVIYATTKEGEVFAVKAQ
ncbi:MAG: DUF4388 domain-containing protein [Planctomycetota bacterium]|jgi:outer membrane protein assembly factor BamB